MNVMSMLSDALLTPNQDKDDSLAHNSGVDVQRLEGAGGSKANAALLEACTALYDFTGMCCSRQVDSPSILSQVKPATDSG